MIFLEVLWSVKCSQLLPHFKTQWRECFPSVLNHENVLLQMAERGPWSLSVSPVRCGGFSYSDSWETEHRKLDVTRHQETFTISGRLSGRFHACCWNVEIKCKSGGFPSVVGSRWIHTKWWKQWLTVSVASADQSLSGNSFSGVQMRTKTWSSRSELQLILIYFLLMWLIFVLNESMNW